MKKFAGLFLIFLKIGAFTFGGGYAMVALLENEFVSRRGWLNKEEFLDMTAIAESTPGPVAINSATYLGYKLAKVPGAATATVAVCLPSFLIILAIAIFLTPEAITGNEHLSAIFKGIRPAVVALIIAPVLNAVKAAHLNMVTVWIPVIVALAIWSSTPVISNPILWIVLAIVVGIAHLKGYFKRNRKGGDAQ